MLEKVALHQTQYRTPGVTPDARGVLLGQRGVVLFPSVDRLVAFLRAYSDQLSLDDLIPTVEIKRLKTPLNAREIMLSIESESSYRMDSVAGIAKLAGGLIFTGTARHFVKYRDATAPLGYDVLELIDNPSDVILYHDTFQQEYVIERDLKLVELLFRLTPHRIPTGRDDAPAELLWASVEMGLAPQVMSYLFRWRVEATAAVAEWAPASAFDDQGKRLHILRLENVPARIVRLLEEVPGVHLFEPRGPRAAVERGFDHPVELRSCGSIFPSDTLYLFTGAGDVLVVDPLPAFAPIRSLVGARLVAGQADLRLPAQSGEASPKLRVPLTLAHSSDPWRRVTATVIPLAQTEWLARILYALPPETLESLSLAKSEGDIYLLSPKGIEGVPLGVFFSEAAPRIFVPAGMKLIPSVSPVVLQELVAQMKKPGYTFFRPDKRQPVVLPPESVGPLTRAAIAGLAGEHIAATALSVEDEPLPLLHYDDARRFPLRGVVKEESKGS